MLEVKFYIHGLEYSRGRVRVQCEIKLFVAIAKCTRAHQGDVAECRKLFAIVTKTLEPLVYLDARTSYLQHLDS
jgi:hypothetical protein